MKASNQITFVGDLGGDSLQNIADALEKTGLADSAVAFNLREALGEENNLFLEAVGSSVWTYGKGAQVINSLQALPVQELIILSPEEKNAVHRLGSAVMKNILHQKIPEKKFRSALEQVQSFAGTVGECCIQMVEDFAEREHSFPSVFEALTKGKVWSPRINYVRISEDYKPPLNDIQQRVLKRAGVSYHELPGTRDEIVTNAQGLLKRVREAIDGSLHSAA